MQPQVKRESLVSILLISFNFCLELFLFLNTDISLEGSLSGYVDFVAGADVIAI